MKQKFQPGDRVCGVIDSGCRWAEDVRGTIIGRGQSRGEYVVRQDDGSITYVQSTWIRLCSDVSASPASC